MGILDVEASLGFCKLVHGLEMVARQSSCVGLISWEGENECPGVSQLATGILPMASTRITREVDDPIFLLPSWPETQPPLYTGRQFSRTIRESNCYSTRTTSTVISMTRRLRKVTGLMVALADTVTFPSDVSINQRLSQLPSRRQVKFVALVEGAISSQQSSKSRSTA